MMSYMGSLVLIWVYFFSSPQLVFEYLDGRMYIFRFSYIYSTLAYQSSGSVCYKISGKALAQFLAAQADSDPRALGPRHCVFRGLEQASL